MIPPLEGLRSVMGHDHVVSRLRRARASDSLAGTYLFEGPDGVGKERTARALAQASVCDSPRADGDACAACAPCRAVAAGTHVDIVTLARDVDVLTQQADDDPRTELVIDKVRKLQAERLVYLPFLSRRWVIVRNAHELNEESSNALLKTLEEPPTRTHFILITPRPSALLSTIRSRCQRVRFAPLGDQLVADLLSAHEVVGERAERAASIADGSIAKALALCDGDTLERYTGWADRIVAVVDASKPGRLVELADELKKSLDKTGRERHEISEVFSLVARRYRDLARAHVVTQSPSAMRAAARADVAARAITALVPGANLQMAIESLCLRLMTAES